MRVVFLKYSLSDTQLSYFSFNKKKHDLPWWSGMTQLYWSITASLYIVFHARSTICGQIQKPCNLWKWSHGILIKLFTLWKPFRIYRVDRTAAKLSDKTPVFYTCKKQINANFKIMMLKESVSHFLFSFFNYYISLKQINKPLHHYCLKITKCL